MAEEPNTSEHRAMGWAAIGAALIAIGLAAAGTLAAYNRWSNDVFLAAFALAWSFVAGGIYVLFAEFVVTYLPLPLTRREREASREQPPDAPPAAEPAQEAPVAVSRDEISLAERQFASARILAGGLTGPPSRVPAAACEQELETLRVAGSGLPLSGDLPGRLGVWSADCERWLGYRLDADEQQRFRNAGTDLPAAGELEAKLDYLRDELWPKVRAGYWAPPATPEPQLSEQARRSAIKEGENILRGILQLEISPPVKFQHAQELTFYEVGALIERWARRIKLDEDVPKFTGDFLADLPRLKLIVQTGLTQLRDAPGE